MSCKCFVCGSKMTLNNLVQYECKDCCLIEFKDKDEFYKKIKERLKNMPKLYNYTFHFVGQATYTAKTEEEALEMFEKQHCDVDITRTEVEEYDPYEDDFMGV